MNLMSRDDDDSDEMDFIVNHVSAKKSVELAQIFVNLEEAKVQVEPRPQA